MALRGSKVLPSAVAVGVGASFAWWVWRRLSDRLAARVTLRGLGDLQGEVTDGITRFLAVPFASAERWRPPVPPTPWAGRRSNPHVLPRCPQPPTDFGDPKHTLSGHTIQETEDCLVLNVYSPDLTPKGQLAPIIFYIHGGAGKLGDCHRSSFSGQELAKQQGAVYVACNYRLGALGYLAHPALSAEDEAAPEDVPYGCGCYGILDIIAALKFVRAHGASFGGDPNNVTIWGLSTGAQFVGHLDHRQRA